MSKSAAGRARDVLVGLAVRDRARDGDCLTWAPEVTDVLERAGLAAELTLFAGRLDGGVLGFLHAATVFDGLVADVTARQFDLGLPQRWVAAEDEYCRVLATATGVTTVSRFG